jgi:hypothetical protein
MDCEWHWERIGELTMKKIRETKSAADLAVEELLRLIPQQRIDADLLAAIQKAKRWYSLHGKRFTIPTGKATKGKN